MAQGKHPFLKTLLVIAGIAAAGYAMRRRRGDEEDGKPLIRSVKVPRKWHPHALVAHRGLHGDAVPENSLAAFRAAMESGYCIELDCRLTADGIPVVFHDDNLNRMCGVNGQLSERAYPEIAWLPLEQTDENIPSLREALSVIDGKVPVMVEVKVDSDDWELATREVIAVLDEYDGVFCVESFDYRCVKMLRESRPNWEIGLLVKDLDGADGAIEVCSYPDYIACKWSAADAEKVEGLYGQYDVPAVAWTVRSEEEMEAAAAKGFSVFVFEGFEPALQMAGDELAPDRMVGLRRMFVAVPGGLAA